MFRLIRFSILAVAVLAASPLLAKLKYDVDAYVQDGLVVNFDGVRNAGADNAHDPSAAVWADVSGNGNGAEFLTVTEAGRWMKNGYLFSGGSYAQITNAVPLGLEFTLQLVTDTPGGIQKPIGSEPVYFTDVTGGFSIFSYTTSRSLTWKADSYGGGSWDNKNGGRANLNGWNGRYLTAAYDDVTRFIFQGDTYPVGTNRLKWVEVPANNWMFGGKANEKNCVRGMYHAVRIYNRRLTAEEIKRNFELDEIRFRGAGIPVTNVVVATSVPNIEGKEVSGVYAVDGSHSFTAPQSAVRGEREFALQGYRLELWDAETGDWGDGEVYSGNEFLYDTAQAAGKVRLTWLWKVSKQLDEKFDIDDYVQEGLIGHFDGIRNAGRCLPHDDSAAGWNDLSASFRSAAFNVKEGADAGEWTNDGYLFKGSSYAIITNSLNMGLYSTVQLVTDIDTSAQNGITLFGAVYEPFNLFTYVDGNKNAVYFKAYGTTGVGSGSYPVCSGWSGKYLNGILDYIDTAVFQGTEIPACKPGVEFKAAVGAQKWCWGGVYYQNDPHIAGMVSGVYHSVRMYNRVLSGDELVWNRRVDEGRFRGPTSFATSNVVVVASRVSGLSGSEECGNYRAVGWTFTADGGTKTLNGKDYVCDGYVVEIWNATTKSWELSERGTSRGWTSPANDEWASRRLTWKWRVVRGIRNAYDVGDYVQEGLIGHFDGIRNAGADKAHDGNAVQWADLSEKNIPATFVRLEGDTGHWTKSGYRFEGLSYAQLTGGLDPGLYSTVQLACDIRHEDYKARSTVLFGGPSSEPYNIFTYNWEKVRNVHFKTYSTTGVPSGSYPKCTGWEGKYLTGVLDYIDSAIFQGVEKPAYIEGVKFGKPVGAQKFCWGGLYYKDEPYLTGGVTGIIHSVRLYNRVLTDEELAWNRTVDEARFRGAGIALTNVIVASSRKTAEGREANGPYEVQGKWTFTAEPVADEDGKVKFKPAGYTLETWNEASGAWSSLQKFEGSSYLHDTEVSGLVRLTWLWESRIGLSVIVR